MESSSSLDVSLGDVAKVPDAIVTQDTQQPMTASRLGEQVCSVSVEPVLLTRRQV